jgi:2-keto-4-pentenoate hydratase/2-oxohepta-3-ene-1,7-dioic acid hydratase in catechol pathway
LRSDQVDFEAELGVVIGYACKNVSRADAMNYVLGYTIANDVSARDWQKQWGGSQWCRGKTFDTFCPLGPALVTPTGLKNPNDLAIRTRVNGVIMQESNTRDMIFPIDQIIEFLSGSTTLEPGTLILTGTPEGVGMGRKPPVYLKAGDVVEVDIEGIGILRNPVVEEELS